MSTIPASEIVNVTPSVLSAGGNAIDVIGLCLTESTRPPIGSVLSFPDQPSVADYFGSSSQEASLATIYFAGFVNATKNPASILFAQYNNAAVAAYLRGGSLASTTLAALQALTGSLTVVMDGYSHVISSISLAAYNSFSAIAAAIQAAFTDPTEASFTGSIGAAVTGSIATTVLTVTAVAGGIISVGDAVGGSGVTAGTVITALGTGTGGTGTYTVNNSQSVSSEALTITSNVLDATVDTDHTIAVGQTVSGTSVAAGTLITAQISGTVGGVGLYSISGAAQHVVSEAMTGVATAPTVTYDSVSDAFVITSGITGAPSTAAFSTGTLSASLLLTSATGAVLSQGAAAAVPAAFMNGVVGVNSDWATFFTAFDPDASGNTVKQAFAAWKNTQNERFAYVCWDTDVTPAASVPATGSLGYILANNNDSGTALLDGDVAAGWDSTSGPKLAAFVAGAAASINFDERNGRITFAFKSQEDLVATVSTAAVAANLGGNPQTNDRGNGYNFYGAYAQANSNFVWFQRGFVTGSFLWLDSFINQIWLNNSFQAALLALLGGAKSISYNTAGYAQIETALAGTIAAGLNFGAFAPGSISQSQATAVDQAAGATVSGTLQTQGYYLQVRDPSSTVRAARTSPVCKFWYLDRGSVQSIDLSSVLVQ